MIRDASPECIALIQRSEGFRASVYMDVAGVWTIGYGTAIRYGSRILRGKEDEALARSLYPNGISEVHAAAMMLAKVHEACRDVERLAVVDLTQGQFDACVDFVYNLGPGSFSKSTLLRKIQARDHAGAAKEFERWIYAGTPPVKLPGLVTRRAAERELYERAA